MGGGSYVCARLPGVRPSSRRSRIAAAVLSALATLLVVAPAAFAENGVGLAGPTTDKTVTFVCFGVIGLFALLVIVLSLIQGRLEKRKEQRHYELQRYG
jgi:putative copper export protein